MNVAARKSRFAKIASPSWTNMPPSAGGVGGTNGWLGAGQHGHGRQERAGHGRKEPPTVDRAPRAEKRQELGDEAGRGRQPEGREAADREGGGDPRHRLAKSAHLSDVARVRLLVDESDQREEEAGH